MKIIALGDTHGRNDWKKVVEENDFDKIIFIGDYFDSHEEVNPLVQKSNFREIISYKKKNKEKVVLLFGNHDFHYLRGITQTYSGFQIEHYHDIQELLENALKENLLQMSFSFNNYLFTHAGVTKTWLNNHGYNEKDNGDVNDFLNTLFENKPLSFGFTSGVRRDPYGDDITQSPIWVRPESLLEDSIGGFKQVVGHTTQTDLTFANNIIFIDCIGTSGEFLIIEDGKESVGKVKRD